MVFALYLKSLEIQGFKSFPEKTRITFDKPITGIVGPNGSGKSNIADAVLWVMGEQSTKTLRGGKMEDVIFGGTQRRSQLGFAEVSLILDNPRGSFGIENSEIMLTRRYYRSGESEYYINRALVRLRDLSELLMDTGLGREGYSIIGQGKISEILSTKSKDRRDIFEEAAGISRFRHRKEEAERKLQHTDENLVRIGDIISELDLQLTPLREQAEIAKRYLLLRDELRGIEISVWLRELDSLSARAEKADNDYASAKLAYETASHEVESGFAKSEALSERMRQCDIDAEAIRSVITASQSQSSAILSDIAVLKSQLEGNSAQIERINEELRSQDAHQDGVGSQISERKERLDEIEAEERALRTRMDSLTSELMDITGCAGASNEELGVLLKREDDSRAELSDRKSDLSALASQAQELYDMENSVRLEIAAAVDGLEEIKAEHKKQSEELDKAREEAETLGNVVNGLSMKTENRIKHVDAATEKADRLSLEHKTLESKKNMLAEMEREYQGYSKAVKSVMQARSRGALKNIHGTAAELVKTGDRYTVAIETALGGAMQHIIVDTEDDGKAAIGFLKHRDGGRATFLPISTIKGNLLNDRDLSSDSGFEGIALNLVEFDPKYIGIYTSLLGRVVIADTLNSAIRIANKHGHRLKIVTLDGQVMNVGGSMTGGSTASHAGVLSRANELGHLSDRIGTCLVDLEKAQRELSESIREKNAVTYELDIASAELRSAEERVLRQQIEQSHRLQALQSAEASIKITGNELESIGSRISLNNSATVSVRMRITAIESEQESHKTRIDEAMRGQEKLSADRERVTSALSELRAREASLKAEKDALSKSVSELSALRDELYGSRDRQLMTIDELNNDNVTIYDDILARERSCAAVQHEIESYDLDLSKLNESKLALEAKRTSINKLTQEKNQQQHNLDRECSRLEQRKLTAQMEEKQILDKLWDTYELSRSTALSAGAQIESVAEAHRRISAIKQQISQLGVPNIGAIDEFERVNTRYEFMSSQRDDVEKAKEEILGIINEVTTQMREIFLREFGLINACFEKTFKELFDGGHACLELEDPEDVLGCGIEINVQPPGKSLKTLTLLSGGEKAFVAIAIYFAILTVRPPPFVVMDEIDAALDDANVLRFAEHLRRMSVNTQMIVISHKRGTMEEADIIYGVTMQELGVSTLLRIDLDEAEKHMASKVSVR